MPRIRKKTSKRGSTNQREKIKHKAAETRKKTKKAAKKNVQWKSKQPKDPGIPNNFPYKDQILAEVAEERRKIAEEKERRKEEKRHARAKGASAEGEDREDGSGDEGGVGFDGITGLSAGTQTRAGGKKAAPTPADVAAAEPADDVPVLINRALPHLQSVLDRADVVLQVLDARDPARSRSGQLEALAPGKKTLLVLSKIDACPREAVAAWAATLRAQRPTVLFRAASAFLPVPLEPTGKGKAKERADDAWGADEVLSCLHTWAQAKAGDEPLTVAVVGVTNAGKSSFVNSLLRKAALPTYRLSSAPLDGPTTTRYPQEVTVDVDGKQIRLVDTPGLAWKPIQDQTADETERTRAQDILLRNRGKIERLKDPFPVVAEIVSRAEREDLMLFYNIAAFADGNATAFLSGIARSNSLIKKGGAPDLAGASRIVLRDWGTGKLPRYTMPPAAAAAAAPDAAFAELYAKNEQLLARLTPRKDMRRGGGIVKLISGDVESRQILLDVPWVPEDAALESDEETPEGADGSSEEEEDVDESESEDEEVDDEAEEDEESDEEDEAPAPTSGKRKRGPVKQPESPARPAKKVAFAANPKQSKQARSAAGAAPSRAALRKDKASATPAPASNPSLKSSMKQGPKTALKAKPALKKAPVAPKKAANAGAPSKNAAAPRGNDGEEAYDFKKFF